MSDPEPAPRNPAGPSPLRRAGSVRRTSTVDTSWLDGYGQPMLMTGRARDLRTPVDGSAPGVLAEGDYQILASGRREVLSIATSADLPALQRMVGQRGGGNLRALLAEIVPEERAAGTPLYLILDDFSGASLVAGWAWSQWRDSWMPKPGDASQASTAGKNGQMEGICSGFRPGSTALNPDGTSNPIQSSAAVPSLLNPDDPLGWHALADQAGVGMRRARRIDVWRENGVVTVDMGFQDSATSPRGGRVAIHEYLARATVDPETLELTAFSADPRILPYRECPSAVPHAQRIVGAHLPDLRLKVLEVLPGILGCTHLNDVMRSLAEVPQLLGALDA